MNAGFLPARRLTRESGHDTDGQPHLGYHYDVLDYLVRNVTVSGAALRLAPGCAVAVYGTPGFDLLSGARWESTGTPLKLNRLVRYQAVQEQPVILGNNPGNMMTLLRVPGSPPPLPQMEFRLTEVALLADSARRRTLFDNGGIHQADRLTFSDCRLYGVNLSVGTYRLLGDHRLMSFALTNTLTERCDIVASEESADPELPSLVVHLRNNLFRNGTLGLADYLETGAWSVRDNLFDTVALVGLGVANSHNGYISTTVLPGSGGGDKTIAPPADYQQGPLGPYYYPSSGTKLAQLIDAGSRSAADAGLACATTRVDHQPDVGTVDIGFHYRLLQPPTLLAGCFLDRLVLYWVVDPEAAPLVQDFLIKRATTPGGPYAVIGVADARSRSFEDLSVEQGITYYYVVTWRHAAGCGGNLVESCPSNEVSMRTCPECDPVWPSWVFTDLGFLAGGQNGAAREYTNPNQVPASPWSFPATGECLNSVSGPNRFLLRLNFEDDGNCIGFNTNAQWATASATISIGCRTWLVLNWCGFGERHHQRFELMTVYVDAAPKGSSQSPGGFLECAASVVPVEGSPTPPVWILLEPGEHTIQIESTTKDEKYHFGAYYEWELRFLPTGP